MSGCAIIMIKEGDKMARKPTGRPDGRPLIFKSAEELDAKIEEFYEYCEERELPLTFERLSVFLNVDRKTIWNYEQKDEFFPCIKRVRERILADLMEKGLTGGINNTFGIFCLKNYGYTDKQEIESKNENINTNKNIDMNNISTEDLKKLIEEEE